MNSSAERHHVETKSLKVMFFIFNRFIGPSPLTLSAAVVILLRFSRLLTCNPRLTICLFVLPLSAPSFRCTHVYIPTHTQTHSRSCSPWASSSRLVVAECIFAPRPAIVAGAGGAPRARGDRTLTPWLIVVGSRSRIEAVRAPARVRRAWNTADEDGRGGRVERDVPIRWIIPGLVLGVRRGRTESDAEIDGDRDRERARSISRGISPSGYNPSNTLSLPSAARRAPLSAPRLNLNRSSTILTWSFIFVFFFSSKFLSSDVFIYFILIFVCCFFVFLFSFFSTFASSFTLS